MTQANNVAIESSQINSSGVLQPAGGGTGATTTAAAFNALNPMTTTGDIIYEASAGTAARLAVGSTGQVLTVASGAPSWATASSGIAGIGGQAFTSNGTFTIPTGVTLLKITVVGGGGGGGGYSGNYVCAGGGGGGCAIRYLTGLTAGNTLAVTVGAAGTAGANTNGGSGGNSTVASGTQTVTTTTGSGGGGGSGAYFSSNTPGAGGTGTNGSINISGGPGGQAAFVATYSPCGTVYFGYGGGGGGSALGSGAPISGGGGGVYPGANGGGIGGGGSGAYYSAYGGAGTAGAVIIEW